MGVKEEEESVPPVPIDYRGGSTPSNVVLGEMARFERDEL